MFSKKIAIAAVATALFGAVQLTPPQSAAADVVVTAGTLDFDPAGAPTIGDFAGVTLNGTPQLTSLTVDPFTIIDATGADAGWHVLLTIPDLVNGLDTIAASNVSMSAPVVSAGAGSSMTGVTGNASAGAFDTGEKIVVATAGEGQGVYHVSPQVLKLTVPQTALVGTYVSAGTIAVNSGP